MGRVNSIPVEARPFLLLTCIMAAFFLAALVRIALLRRAETRLQKNKEALEKQVLSQQGEIMAIRSDSQQWRAEMKREFDGFRAMASDQLRVEERRFDELLKRSERRQIELQTALDVAKQMCAELPAAKARVIQLEQKLGIAPDEAISPIPISPGGSDSGGGGLATMVSEPRRAWNLPAVPSVDEGRVGELERSLATARQQNAALLKALTAARLRNRNKARMVRAKAGR